MVSPITRSPRARNIPATTELSTPPDMATAIVLSDIRGRNLSQVRNGLDKSAHQRIDLLHSIRPAQGKSDAGPCLLLG
jgi:hypothetical protein